MNENIKNSNPLVAIACSVSGFSSLIVFLFALYSGPQVWVAAPIVMALATMGVCLGYFSSKQQLRDENFKKAQLGNRPDMDCAGASST